MLTRWTKTDAIFELSVPATPKTVTNFKSTKLLYTGDNSQFSSQLESEQYVQT